MVLFRLVILLAAVVVSAAQGTCPGLAITAKSSRRKLASGTPVKVTVTVKNKGATALDGVGVRLSAFVAGDWKTSAPKRAGANLTNEGNLVLWSNYQLGPRKGLTFRARGRACAGLEAGIATLAEASVFQVDADDNVICWTSMNALMVRTCSAGDVI